MNPTIVIIVITLYFLLLIVISNITSKNADVDSFFTGNKQSPWYVVAFGMIGASLSGITFISVPGIVGNSNFYYYQLVMGYMLGYFVIATILLPLYYRLNLVSIYEYLGKRFGIHAQKTGSFYFLISQSVGAALRLFVVAGVLQLALFDYFNIPFFITVIVTIALIWIYTHKAGIKTIVWTDTLQTLFMLMSVVVCIYFIAESLDFSFFETINAVASSDYSKVFNWELANEKNFFKQFISGALIAIVMTGLDQNMMQKNLTCKNIEDAKKNVLWFSISILFTNLLFLTLGVLLYLYASEHAMVLDMAIDGSFLQTDKLFPDLALNFFTPFVGIIFLLGITAAAFSSADSALTSLTTSWCKDFGNISSLDKISQTKKKNQAHLVFSAILFLIIIIFKWISDDSIINAVFTIAGYTYGPLLGMFTFGIVSKIDVNDRRIPLICLVSPVLAYFINYSLSNYWQFELGYTVLLINGLITMIGLYLNKTSKYLVAVS